MVIIDEVPEGNWGTRGQTVSLVRIADTVGLAKVGERFAWVRARFDAKRRRFTAVGYPPGHRWTAGWTMKGRAVVSMTGGEGDASAIARTGRTQDVDVAEDRACTT